MAGPSKIALTLLTFVAVMSLVLTRPRGYHEAWWTTLGAALALSLGLVDLHDVAGVIARGQSALLFLVALLLLSVLLERSAFFEWAAMVAGRTSHGNAAVLFRNVFILGALTTMVLSLDTTAVILTPIVLSVTRRLRQPAAPFVIACAFVANMASLLLPVSNLTNLIFADAFHLPFASFVARMFLPQLVSLAVTFLLLSRYYRSALAAPFDTSDLPLPMSVVPHRPFFAAATTILGLVLVGYFVAPLLGLAPYVAGFAGALSLLVFGLATRRVKLGILAEVSWGVLPFVVGLFVVVKAVENLGIAKVTARWLATLAPGVPTHIAFAAGFTAVASNLMNNLPAALVAQSALQAAHGDRALQFGALLGANLGPNILPFGSLATMLVLDAARKKGAEVKASQFINPGIWITPIVLLAASLALALTFVWVK